MDIKALQATLRALAHERDWGRFHSPKNLSIALSVEAAELMEHFQWMSEEQSRSLEAALLAKVAEEVANVQIYLARLADELGIDIDAAVAKKIESNRQKYPPDPVRGQALEHADYEGSEK